jgi:hypothetical protein
VERDKDMEREKERDRDKERDRERDRDRELSHPPNPPEILQSASIHTEKN